MALTAEVFVHEGLSAARGERTFGLWDFRKTSAKQEY